MIDDPPLCVLRPLALESEHKRGTSQVRSLGGAFVARLELLDDGRICITATERDSKWPPEGLERDPYAPSLSEALCRLERARAAILADDLEPIPKATIAS